MDGRRPASSQALPRKRAGHHSGQEEEEEADVMQGGGTRRRRAWWRRVFDDDNDGDDDDDDWYQRSARQTSPRRNMNEAERFFGENPYEKALQLQARHHLRHRHELLQQQRRQQAQPQLVTPPPPQEAQEPQLQLLSEPPPQQQQLPQQQTAQSAEAVSEQQPQSKSQPQRLIHWDLRPPAVCNATESPGFGVGGGGADVPARWAAAPRRGLPDPDLEPDASGGGGQQWPPFLLKDPLLRHPLRDHMAVPAGDGKDLDDVGMDLSPMEDALEKQQLLQQQLGGGERCRGGGEAAAAASTFGLADCAPDPYLPDATNVDLAHAVPADSVSAVLENADLLKTVLMGLPVVQLCRVACVARLWMRVVHNPSFWRKIDLLGRNTQADQVLRLCRRQRGSIEELRVGGSMMGPNDAALLQRLVPLLNRLNTLELHAWSLTERALSQLSWGLPSLRNLVLRDVNLVGGLGVQGADATLSHPSVTSLELSRCKTCRLALSCPQLLRLSIRTSQFAAFSLPGTSLPSLEYLHIASTQRLADQIAAVTSLTSLRHLSLDDVPVSEELLRGVARSLERLTELEIRDCAGLVLVAARGPPSFPSLRRLAVSRCEALSSATAGLLLEGCSGLEDLVLDGCGQLSSLMATLPLLRSVSLRGCRMLTTLELKCRRLEELSLGSLAPGGPGGAVLRRVVVASDALRGISWQHLPSLEELALDCPALTSLSLTDCDSLTDKVFDMLKDMQEVVLSPAPPPKLGPAAAAAPRHQVPRQHHQRHAALTGPEPQLPLPQQMQPARRDVGGNREAAADATRGRQPFRLHGMGLGPRDRDWDRAMMDAERDSAEAIAAVAAADVAQAAAGASGTAAAGEAYVESAIADGSSEEEEEAEAVGGSPRRQAAGHRDELRRLSWAGGSSRGGDAAAGLTAAADVGGSSSSVAAAGGVGWYPGLPCTCGASNSSSNSSGPSSHAALRPPQLQPQGQAAQPVVVELVGLRSAWGTLRRSGEARMAEEDPHPQHTAQQPQPHPLPLLMQPQQPADAAPLAHLPTPPPPSPPVALVAHPKLGGCPRLEELRLEGCDGLRHAQLRHGRLATASFRGCRGLLTLRMSCPSLEALVLEECGELDSVALSPVRLSSLSLGACCALRAAELVCPSLEQLSLKGCGNLSHVILDCPQLRELDATFCGDLTDQALATALARRPPLASLVLSVCCSLGPAMTTPLSVLSGLRHLDLSYSSVSRLALLLSGCTGLTALCLGSCPELAVEGGEELLQLLPERGHALPFLVSLDVSYCPLSPRVVVPLVSGLTHLTHLALNGCTGADEGIWRCAILETDIGQGRDRASCRGHGLGLGHGLQEQTPARRDKEGGKGETGARAGTVRLGCAQECSAAWNTGPAASAEEEAAAKAASQSPYGAATAAAAAGASQLEKLSLVRCPSLVSLCLGLVPVQDAAAQPPPGANRQGSSSGGGGADDYGAGGVDCSSGNGRGSGGGCELAGRPAAGGATRIGGRWCGWQWPEGGPPPLSLLGPPWRAVGCVLSELRSLRLGLSGVQAVALSLPHLTHLDMNGCSALRRLELRCPALAELHLQACCALPADLWLPLLGALGGVTAADGCGLTLLDAQHAGAFGEAVAATLAAAAVMAAAATDDDTDPGPACSSGTSSRSSVATAGPATSEVRGGGGSGDGGDGAGAGGGLGVQRVMRAGKGGGVGEGESADGGGGGRAGGVVLTDETLLAARNEPWWLLPRGATVLACGPDCTVCGRRNRQVLLGLSP